MRWRVCVAAGIAAFLALSAPAGAGIVINQYQTIGETNAWAPLDTSQYYQKQTLTNVSPASADATGDWTGTNVGGSTNTWHWVGHGHMDSITSASPTSLTITGSGFFSSDLTTTPDFVDPNSQAVLYVPGSAGSYNCDFTVDAPASYAAAAELGRWSGWYFASFDTGVIFNQTNQTPASTLVSFAGTLPPGHYFFSATANLYGIPFTGHDDGRINNFSFTVQVPEPEWPAAALLPLLVLHVCVRRRRLLS